MITEVTLKLYPLPEAVSGGDLPLRQHRGRGEHRRSRSSSWACRSRAASCSTSTPCARSMRRQAQPARVADAADGVPRQPGGREGAGRDGAGDRPRDGRRGFRVGEHAEERTRLWTHATAYFAGLQTNPGCRTVTTDTCVPISRLTEIIDASVVADADLTGLPYHRRPRRRRQLPHRLPGRDGATPKQRDRRAAQRPAGAPRDRARGHLHRRARHRPAQDGFLRRGGRHRRGGDDARGQAGARPEEHPQPGKIFTL